MPHGSYCAATNKTIAMSIHVIRPPIIPATLSVSGSLLVIYLSLASGFTCLTGLASCARTFASLLISEGIGASVKILLATSIFISSLSSLFSSKARYGSSVFKISSRRQLRNAFSLCILFSVYFELYICIVPRQITMSRVLISLVVRPAKVMLMVLSIVSTKPVSESDAIS